MTCRLFQNIPGRLVPDGWVGPKSSGCRCHFRAFQLKLFILDIQNFGNGPVVKKLQLFENGFPLNLLAPDLNILHLFKEIVNYLVINIHTQVFFLQTNLDNFPSPDREAYLPEWYPQDFRKM